LSFSKLQNQLGKNFLDRTFLEQYRKPKGSRTNENFSKLEFVVSPVCNLGCKYCYINRYGDDLYPKELIDDDTILENTSLILDWLIKNEMTPDLELFSGELFAQKVGFKIYNLIYNKYKDLDDKLKPRIITSPTNYTFLLKKDITDRVEDIIDKFESINIRVGLSASVEGRYMEQNRPINHKFDSEYYDYEVESGSRDEEYYDKLFSFNKKHNMGFHPMVYSSGIEYWIDNFIWFQEKFDEYNFPFYQIYLLEVRNEEWSDRQIKDFCEFIEFLIRWTYENPCNGSDRRFSNFIFRQRGYNILSKPFTSIGRGLGCSLQSDIYLRLGDLSFFPCHRTMYPQFKLGEFVKESGKIKDIKVENPELLTSIISMDSNNWPGCETCIVKYSCSKGCVGSQFESTGELFTPIPSVCKLEHNYLYTVAKTCKDIGVFESLVSRTQESRAYGIRKILEIGGSL